MIEPKKIKKKVVSRRKPPEAVVHSTYIDGLNERVRLRKRGGQPEASLRTRSEETTRIPPPLHPPPPPTGQAVIHGRRGSTYTPSTCRPRMYICFAYARPHLAPVPRPAEPRIRYCAIGNLKTYVRARVRCRALRVRVTRARASGMDGVHTQLSLHWCPVA